MIHDGLESIMVHEIEQEAHHFLPEFQDQPFCLDHTDISTMSLLKD